MKGGGRSLLEIPEKSASTSNGHVVRSFVARLLLNKLAEQSQGYCILTGYEGLPDDFDSDIDFMVGEEDFRRVPEWIASIAQESNTTLFQVIPHEVSARAFRLAMLHESELTLIQPDSCFDYRHFGRLWFRAEEVLRDRRMHDRGFWIPSARHEFVYYLIKRLNKQDFRQEHGARLSRLYAEDPENCTALLRRFWTMPTVEGIAKMAQSGDWQPLMTNLLMYRQEMLRHSSGSVGEKAITRWKNVQHDMERILFPTGGWIAFIGPDGCGKSSVIEAIVREFAPAFQKIERFHLRPGLFPGHTKPGSAVTDPHGKPARSLLMSVAKMAYLASDYWLGWILRVRPAMMRTRLVVFDRYFYDILVDPKRVRYGGPKWFLSLLLKVLPEPELVVLLDAPPEVLWSRKQEVPFEEVVRQQESYRAFSKTCNRVVVVDAAQPLRTVVQQTAQALLTHFSRRTYARLNLGKEENR